MTGAQPDKPSSPEAHPHEAVAASSQVERYQEETKKWGTYLMGQPCVPGGHPDNQKAAVWKAGEIHSPIGKRSVNPFRLLTCMFTSRKRKGNSTTVFTRHFSNQEKLKKAFACYLCTSTGPVAGTLFLSAARVAFCSDRLMCCIDPSGQQNFRFYKTTTPLENVGIIKPVIMRENQQEKYIEMVSFINGGGDFWFMGFENFDKASQHLLNSLAEFRAAGNLGRPIVAMPPSAAMKGDVQPSK